MNLYGWPTSPTWPGARTLTENMLQSVSQEFIIGMQGLRYVAGDFNHPESLPSIQGWLQAGWVEIQTLHHQRSGYVPQDTYRGMSRPDRLYISPELAAFFTAAHYEAWFADHGALHGVFQIPDNHPSYWAWPLPAQLPWEEADIQTWHASLQPSLNDTQPTQDPTSHYKHLGYLYETSLDHHLSEHSHIRLPPACLGRGQRLQPVRRQPQAPILRSSRPGEEHLASDVISRAVLRWFRQLRRLQSMHHALKAGGQGPTHQLYRTELWHAILHAPGFQPTFCEWWPTRKHQFQGSPPHLPLYAPSLDLMHNIYNDFRYNFRSFESWNLRQKSKCNQARLQQHHHRIFKAIKPAMREPIDRLVEKHTVAILAVSADGTQIHTDAPLESRPQATWWVDGTPATVKQLSQDTFEIESDLLLVKGQQLHQHHHLSSESQIHSTLEQFWQKRWSKHADLPQEAWKRIFGFVKAYVPKGAINLPRLQLSQWDNTLNKFKAHAARGPDGYGRLDLINMPPQLKQAHLDLLHRIEHGEQWPQQLLNGHAHGLAKCVEAEEVSQYRPIIILSMIYRTWSSIRARQGLQQLEQLMDCPAFGFLPTREAQEIWLPLQGLIELRAQQSQPLVGCVADVEKAFNHLPRGPIKQIAKHVGFDADFVEAWHRFLLGFSRRFKIRDTVGSPLFSNCGYPEGCPLSCLAMALTDWCYHLYQAHFAPRATSISFVDNLEILAHTPGALLQAMVAQETFLDMFQLSIDLDKTYLWAVHPRDRQQLGLLKHRISLKDKDLGGHMTYGPRRRVAHHPTLVQNLQPTWSLLRRLRAPGLCKTHVLVQSMWPKIFHSAPIEDFSLQLIKQLRTAAVRALGHGNAGANPAIRLSLLQGNILADPGFYQLWHVVRTFRRMLLKQAALLDMWHQFQAFFDGHFYAGPFSVLIRQLNAVSWKIEAPPYLTDHDGLQHNILTIDHHYLRSILEDAWRQRVALDASTRTDLQGLRGINWPACRHLGAHHTALQSAQIRALREGAFYLNTHKAKYDCFISATCARCLQPDTVDHRCLHCPGFSTSRAAHPEAIALWEGTPISLRERLLPPRNPHHGQLRRYLHSLHERPVSFEILGDRAQDTHVFSDGTCTSPTYSPLSLAAWSVISASRQSRIASGPLPGEVQSSNRAELYAALITAQWTKQCRCRTHLWTDSAYTATGIWQLQQAPDDIPSRTNADLWQQLSATLATLGEGQLLVHHTAGHSIPAEMDDPVDAWLAHWNNVADYAAKEANRRHSEEFHTLWTAYSQTERDQLHRLACLQELHLAVAATNAENQPTAADGFEEYDLPADADPEPDSGDALVSWPEVLSPDWAQSLPGSRIEFKFDSGFPRQAITWLLQEAEQATLASHISWLEVAVMMRIASLSMPVPTSHTSGEIWRNPSPLLGVQTTLASDIRMTRSFFRLVAVHFGLDIQEVRGINLASLGVAPPQSGLTLKLSTLVKHQARQAIRTFCTGRPIRSANDLSRPFRQ